MLKVIAVIAVLVLILAYPVAYWSSGQELTCTVTDEDRSSDGAGGSKYRVYTKECGVLSNEDSLLQFKWNSADVQNTVKEGKVYKFEVNGWRVGFFSWFPNIDTATEVK
jgi:hypothetical protein